MQLISTYSEKSLPKTRSTFKNLTTADSNRNIYSGSDIRAST